MSSLGKQIFRNVSFVVVVISVLGVTLGCSIESETISEEKVISCTDKQTITREQYDLAIEKFKARKDISDFESLSKFELFSIWLHSSVLIEAFEDDLRACVSESDGRTTVMVWTQDSLDSENLFFKQISKLLVSSPDKGFENDDQTKKSGDKNSTSSIKVNKPPQKLNIELPSLRDLKKFVTGRLEESIRSGKVSFELENVSIYKSNNEYSDSELVIMAKTYYSSNFTDVRKMTEEFLALMITNYVSPSSKIISAKDDARFLPVIKYFKKNYSKDLTNVVVIDSPLSSIPHAAGSFAQHALGLYISPFAIPIKISVKLPLRFLDSSMDKTTYLSGTLIVKIEDQLQFLLDGLKFYFGSERVFHIDSGRVKGSESGSLEFQSTVAHELRHLVDYFDCINSQSEDCQLGNIQQDIEEVRREGRVKKDENYKKFLADPDTLQAKQELLWLYGRYRTSSTFSERTKWAESMLDKFFNGNYMPQYDNFFSSREKSGYKETLKFLMSKGLSKKRAIDMIIDVYKGDNTFKITMDGENEPISWPGFPWIKELLESLVQ